MSTEHTQLLAYCQTCQLISVRVAVNGLELMTAADEWMV